MRQFNYFANGGPYPGVCLSCGNNKELYDLGKDQVDGSSHLLCVRCVAEVANFTGYILREPAMREHDHLKKHIKDLETKLDKVPNLVEGLINGVRSSVADFVLAVSSSDDVPSNSAVQDDAERGSKSARPRKAADSND